MFCNRSCGAAATISLCCRYKKESAGSLLRCTTEMPESGASQWGKKTLRPSFSPHTDICMGPRLYPDTINPAFHLFLALKNVSMRREDCSFSRECEKVFSSFFSSSCKKFPFIRHRSPPSSPSCP